MSVTLQLYRCGNTPCTRVLSLNSYLREQFHSTKAIKIEFLDTTDINMVNMVISKQILFKLPILLILNILPTEHLRGGGDEGEGKRGESTEFVKKSGFLVHY